MIQYNDSEEKARSLLPCKMRIIRENNMHDLKNLLLIFLTIILISACRGKTIITSLPRSTPEEEGVSSEAVLKFVEAADKNVNEIHSFMFLRHGKVIAEGWWHPYRPDLKHTMYSLSKSFTSTAVGFATSEKQLTVNDRVTSFFPYEVPETLSAKLFRMTVKDLYNNVCRTRL